MVFSGLVLSSVVTELTVRPLEKMLKTMRQIASTVFQMTAVVTEEDEDDEMVDIDASSEMKLLEKVVQKLAVIVDLQTRKEPEAGEDMQEEDIAILIMMRGRSAPMANKPGKGARYSGIRQRGTIAVNSPNNIRLEDFGMTQEHYNSFGFNTLSLTKAQRNKIVSYTIWHYPEPGQCLLGGIDGEQTLQRFIHAIEKEYLPNPFHNYAHAVDVVHGVAKLMRLTHAESFLSEVEQFSLLIAAVAHDLGHPGVNNSFLLEVGHELALQYNDCSPLENMHCAKLYTLVGNQSANVFSTLTREDYRESRKTCIEAILHTDMMMHQAMIKDLEMLFQMHSEVFKTWNGLKGDGQASGIRASTSSGHDPELEIFAMPEHKTKLLDMLLHSADVSNPCREWEVTEAWAIVCLEEFFAQGDQEKVLGIPVQFLNDREKLNRPNSQIGFIEFMIAPFYMAQLRLFPQLSEYGTFLAENMAAWEEMWAKDVGPSEEDRQKVLTRVEAVRNKLEMAHTRTEVPT